MKARFEKKTIFWGITAMDHPDFWICHDSGAGTASSPLGRCAEKKSRNSPNVVMQQVSKVFPHRRGAPPSKDMKIRGDFLPSGCSRIRYRAEIKPLDQNTVGPSQTTDHDLQPVCHKQWGYPAVRINVLYRSEKAFSATLPVEKPIKQRSDHGRYRVQHIRDQLVRKQGKDHISSNNPSAVKAG